MRSSHNNCFLTLLAGITEGKLKVKHFVAAFQAQRNCYFNVERELKSDEQAWSHLRNVITEFNLCADM